jgi:hypothetical protein
MNRDPADIVQRRSGTGSETAVRFEPMVIDELLCPFAAFKVAYAKCGGDWR